MEMGRRRVRFQEEGREGRLPGLLFADDLWDESEEDLRAMVGRFVEICRRRGLKVNIGQSKVILLDGKVEFECEFCIDGIRLEYVSEFKYFECILDVSSTNEVGSSRKVSSERRVAVAIRFLS